MTATSSSNFCYVEDQATLEAYEKKSQSKRRVTKRTLLSSVSAHQNLQRGASNMFHNGLSPAHVPHSRVNSVTVCHFCHSLT